jgi:hypothetical protein
MLVLICFIKTKHKKIKKMIENHPLNTWVKALDTATLVRSLFGPHRLVNARATNDIYELTKKIFDQKSVDAIQLPALRKFRKLIAKLPKKQDSSLKIKNPNHSSFRFKKNKFPELKKLVFDTILRADHPNKLKRLEYFEQIKKMDQREKTNICELDFIDFLFEEFLSFEKIKFKLGSSSSQKTILLLKELITPFFSGIPWRQQNQFFMYVIIFMKQAKFEADDKESFLNHLCCSLPEELRELSSCLSLQHLQLMLNDLPNLNSLETSLNNPTDKDLAELVRHPHLQKLERLTLIIDGNPNITDEGWKLLLNLESLNVLSIRPPMSNALKYLFKPQIVKNSNPPVIFDEPIISNGMKEKLIATLQERKGCLEFGPYVCFERFKPQYHQPWDEKENL